jgi:hypothetical protein
MKRQARTEKSDARTLGPLEPAEARSIRAGEGGGLLAFPFIQTAMQGALRPPVAPVPGSEPHG